MNQSSVRAPHPSSGYINLVANESLSVFLLNAIAAKLPPDSKEMGAITKAHQASEPRGLKIEFMVEGVKIPLADSLNELFRIRSERLDELVAERAFEMVTEAGLAPIHAQMEKLAETMRATRWAVKESVEKATGVKLRDED